MKRWNISENVTRMLLQLNEVLKRIVLYIIRCKNIELWGKGWIPSFSSAINAALNALSAATDARHQSIIKLIKNSVRILGELHANYKYFHRATRSKQIVVFIGMPAHAPLSSWEINQFENPLKHIRRAILVITHFCILACVIGESKSRIR